MAYKVFENGFPLAASELNNFLMNQSVIVFDSAGNRSSTLSSPTEGMVTYLKDTNSVEYYNGSAWVVINDNTASVPLSTVTTQGDLIVATGSAAVTRLGKGSEGQVLTAGASGLEWDSAYPAITTAGDLLVGTGAGAVARLGIGADGQALVSNGTTATWGAIAADSMTLISSTSLSGVSTTLSSIPGTYKNLKLVIKNYSVSSGTRTRFRLNEDTGSSYYNWTYATAIDTSDSASTYFFEMARDMVSGSSVNQFSFEFIEYSSDANIKLFQGFAINETASALVRNNNVVGGYINSSAINSITIYTDDGSTTHSGTALLYGVK